MRGAWIETHATPYALVFAPCRPSCEGRGLKLVRGRMPRIRRGRRPSCEGRGLKHARDANDGGDWRSPLMRGAWIETQVSVRLGDEPFSRPSCEGRGLKQGCHARRGYAASRPSCEGRGLKHFSKRHRRSPHKSPLMRGAWIETCAPACSPAAGRVAPHARGVD